MHCAGMHEFQILKGTVTHGPITVGYVVIAS